MRVYHALRVPSTYCQPKMSFQQLNFRFVWIAGMAALLVLATSSTGRKRTKTRPCSGQSSSHYQVIPGEATTSHQPPQFAAVQPPGTRSTPIPHSSPMLKQHEEIRSVSVQFGVVQWQRGLPHVFEVVRLYRTFSNRIFHKGITVCSVPRHLFQVVQPQRTSSNLFEPLQCILQFIVLPFYCPFYSSFCCHSTARSTVHSAAILLPILQ